METHLDSKHGQSDRHIAVFTVTHNMVSEWVSEWCSVVSAHTGWYCEWVWWVCAGGSVGGNSEWVSVHSRYQFTLHKSLWQYLEGNFCDGSGWPYVTNKLAWQCCTSSLHCTHRLHCCWLCMYVVSVAHLYWPRPDMVWLLWAVCSNISVVVLSLLSIIQHHLTVLRYCTSITFLVRIHPASIQNRSICWNYSLQTHLSLSLVNSLQ